MGVKLPAGKKRKVFTVILGVLIGCIYFTVYKKIQDERALNKLYIHKDICQYSHNKRIIIFIDQRAKKSLRQYKISSKNILVSANEILAKEKLPIRYGIASLQIREWDSSALECHFIGAEFSDKRKCFLNEIVPRVEKEKQTGDPDVILFLTSFGKDDASGWTFWNTADGNGTIVLNVGIAKPEEFSKNILGKVKLFYIRCFARILLHEQCHLYGLEHSNDNFDIMHSELANVWRPEVKFNENSREQLISADKKMTENKKQKCSARQ